MPASLQQTTASLNTFTGSLRSEVNLIEAYTASLKGAAIVSSSQQIQNYFTFARTGSANTFYGNQTVVGNIIATRLVANGPTNDFASVAIGTDALSSNSGTYVVGIGLNSLQNNQSVNNIGVGVNTLLLNTTGQANTGIGTNALIINKSGSYNIAIGLNTLANAHGASYNTAVGHTALVNNTTGFYNTAVGAATLVNNTTGFNNTAIGLSALTNNTTGIENSAFGYNSMINTGTGNYNTAIGSSAGGNNTNGANNVFLGYGAGAEAAGPTQMTSVNNSIYVGYLTRGASATGTTNEIVIGNNVAGLGSNSTVLGNTSTALTQIYGNVTASGNLLVSNGNLVIGTSGKGIDFSANTNPAGMTSELLNDYEEGTWTPTFAGTGGNTGQVYDTQIGTYTKVGRLVTFTANITLSTLGTITGFVRIDGLPFTPQANPTTRPATTMAYNTTITTLPASDVYGGNTFMYLYKISQTNPTAATQLSQGDLTNTTSWHVSGFYYTA
jgi:hypothetical protein